jgi:hypothetical protein
MRSSLSADLIVCLPTLPGGDIQAARRGIMTVECRQFANTLFELNDDFDAARIVPSASLSQHPKDIVLPSLSCEIKHVMLG